MRSTFAPSPARKRLAVGAGEHAGQVEHLDPAQRSCDRALPGGAFLVRLLDELHQRFGIHRQPLRMLPPLRPTAHLGGAALGVDHRLLKLRARPLCDFRRQCGTIGAGTEHAFCGGAVVRGVGVQTDPAVPGRIVAGDCVP